MVDSCVLSFDFTHTYYKLHKSNAEVIERRVIKIYLKNVPGIRDEYVYMRFNLFVLMCECV